MLNKYFRRSLTEDYLSNNSRKHKMKLRSQLPHKLRDKGKNKENIVSIGPQKRKSSSTGASVILRYCNMVQTYCRTNIKALNNTSANRDQKHEVTQEKLCGGICSAIQQCLERGYR